MCVQVNYYRNGEDRRMSKRQTVYGQNVGTAMVYGLLPNTFYWFYVQVFTGAGNGPTSTEFQQNTWRLHPQSFPLKVRAEKMEPGTVKVSFVGITITVAEETLDGYIVCSLSLLLL